MYVDSFRDLFGGVGSFEEAVLPESLAGYSMEGPPMDLNRLLASTTFRPALGTSHRHFTLSNLECMSAAELYESIINYLPAERFVAGIENKNPVPADLRERFPTVLSSLFRAGSASLTQPIWSASFSREHRFWASQAEGVSWKFSAGLPSRTTWVRKANLPSCEDPEAKSKLVETLKEWEETGVVERIGLVAKLEAARQLRPFDTPPVHFLLPLHMVFNGKKWRLCWDGRILNEMIEKDTFELETVGVAARLMRRGDWMFTIDLFNGFFQLALREDMRRYCGFEYDGWAYRYNVLPFGISIAPLTFSKVMRLLLQRWRESGIRCSNYVDDWIFFAESEERALRIREQVLEDLCRFGLQVNVEKAHLEPGRTVTYLGYLFDSTNGPRLFVPQDKIQRVVDQAANIRKEVERNRRHGFLGSNIARLVGRLISMRYAIAPVRILTRELLACLRQLPMRTVWRKGRTLSVRDVSRTVVLSDGAICEVRFWELRIHDWNGMLWTTSFPELTLYSDGSAGGWGTLLQRILRGEVREQPIEWSQGAQPDGLSRHSVTTELVALFHGLLAHRETIRGRTVRHRTDSAGVRFGLVNHGFRGANVADLNLLVRKIFLLCHAEKIILQTEYIGSAGIIHSGADALSRQDYDEHLLLAEADYKRARGLLGPGVWPDLDAFAEQSARQKGEDGRPLPYFSREVERTATQEDGWLGVDALAHPWEGKVYAFPHSYLSLQAVEKALASRGTASTILVLFNWPAQPWYPMLTEVGCPFIDLGPISSHASVIRGGRPIEAVNTWADTCLRAWLVKQHG